MKTRCAVRPTCDLRGLTGVQHETILRFHAFYRNTIARAMRSSGALKALSKADTRPMVRSIPIVAISVAIMAPTGMHPPFAERL